jgi:exodeoxyribonuclease VII small subunit
MAKAEKNAGMANPAIDEMPFEDALRKLETIVDSMESDELPLERLLAQFEEGTRLAHTCRAKLAEAELKIQQLEKNIAGDSVLKPFALSEESSEK